jgi:hypothetical protein
VHNGGINKSLTVSPGSSLPFSRKPCCYSKVYDPPAGISREEFFSGMVPEQSRYVQCMENFRQYVFYVMF